MAAPHGDRRRRPVQVEPTERHAGRGQGGAPLPRQHRLEDLDRPRSDPRAAARRLAARRSRDVRAPGVVDAEERRGGDDRLRCRSRSRAARPSSSGSSSSPRRCPMAGPAHRARAPVGWTGDTGSVAVTIPAGTPLGDYQIGVEASNQGRTDETVVRGEGRRGRPHGVRSQGRPAVRRGDRCTANLPVLIQWPAATDPTSGDRRIPVGGQRQRRRVPRDHEPPRLHARDRQKPGLQRRRTGSGCAPRTRPATGVRGSSGRSSGWHPSTIAAAPSFEMAHGPGSRRATPGLGPSRAPRRPAPRCR